MRPGRILLACLAGLALAAGAREAPAQGLDRLTMRTDLLGWEAVGRVELGRGGYCTGTLVAPDIVLTAAHCLFDPETGARGDPAAMQFRAGLRDGETIATRQVMRAVVHAGYDPAEGDDARRIGTDLALLQLANPIPAVTASPFDTRPAVEGSGRVTAVSYGAGRANAASLQAGCRQHWRWNGVLGLDCIAHPGSSGAPVFRRVEGRARIVGVVSGGVDAGEGVRTYAAEAHGALPALLTALRSGEGVWPRRLPVARRIGSGERGGAGGARFLRP